MANILIRVDNSPQVGMGHFNRCSALAYEFAKQNHNVFLVTSKASIIPAWVRNVYKYVLHVDNEWKTDSERVILNELKNITDIDIIIVDTYKASRAYYEFISDYAKVTAAFDDMGVSDVPVNILINGNIYAPKLPYSLYRSGTLLLLGTKYLALRPLFKNIKPIQIKKQAKKILITFGGSDILNATPAVIDTLVHNPGAGSNMEYNVLVGPGFTNIEQIKNAGKDYCNVKLIYNPENVADIMKEADIAISAAGSTVYELACLGIPNIVFTVIDNQELIAKSMCEEKICLDGGFFETFRKEKFLDLVNKILDYDIRLDMHNRAISKFDAFGASRCVNDIMQFAIESKDQ